MEKYKSKDKEIKVGQAFKSQLSLKEILNKPFKIYPLFVDETNRVIDRDLISMDKKMINEKYKPTPKEIYDHYSLSAWVNDIFELND